MNELENDDQIFKKTASALPLVPYDEALTASIMQEVSVLSLSESDMATQQSTTMPQTGQAKEVQTIPVFDWRSVALMVLSFMAFVGFLPLDTGESAWSIASWAVALALLLILQPLLALPAKQTGAKSYA